MILVLAILSILSIYTCVGYYRLEARISYLEHKLYCKEIKERASK